MGTDRPSGKASPPAGTGGRYNQTRHPPDLPQQFGEEDLVGRTAPVIQAGPAPSTHARGAPASFNVIHINHLFSTVELMTWQAQSRQFQPDLIEQFEQREEGD